MIAFDIRFHDSLGSTQDEARRQSQAGAPHGTVITAREQTAGRGRHGRRWASPPGNVYLSILLRLDLPPSRLAELGFVAALAVADSVDAFLPDRAMLKWPNDVLVDGAKISGILIDQAEGAAIVGVGLNVLSPSPCGLGLRSRPRPGGGGEPVQHYPVTSLALVGTREPSVAITRGVLLAAFARRLDAWQSRGFAPVRAAWLLRAHPLGTKLHVSTSAGAIEGCFAGLADDGALLLDTAQGLRRLLVGDVSIRVRTVNA